MLMRILPISALRLFAAGGAGVPSRAWLALSLLLLSLAPARPAFPSVPAPVPAAASDPLRDGTGSLFLNAPPSASETLRSDFKAEFAKDTWNGVSSPTFLLQRAEVGGNGYGLFAEMGDIRIRQTSNTLQEAAGRGGRFGFLTGNSGNSARIETFAAAGALGKAQDDLLVGATGELSLLDSSARLKTIVVSGRHSLDRDGRWPDAGARKGDVLGFQAVLDPFDGKLAAEAEYDYSVYDGNTADRNDAVRDSAYRIKLGGGWGNSRYSALYERTGPQYRLMTGQGPARDNEGVSLGLATAYQLHLFDVKLSRYNDNTENNDLYPRLYRYEGLFDYRFKGFKTLPLALQYRKSFIDSTREPLGHLPKEVEEEAVTGQMNYLAGKWDLGLRGTLSQRQNKLSQRKESETRTLGFLPKLAAGPVTVAPDFSVRRVTDYASNLRTDHWAFNLGLNGALLKKKLDYELKGGYKKEVVGDTGIERQVVGARVKAAYPLARFFNWTSAPSLGIKGEYKGIDNRLPNKRENDFSLLISLDGGKFL